MNCQKEENLNRFLAGEGTDVEREAVEMHFAECSDCRLRLTNLYSQKNEELFLAPNELKERAKNLPQRENEEGSVFGFLLNWQYGFAIASFIVLFSFVGFWVWNTRQIQNNEGGEVLRQGEMSSTAPKLLLPKNNVNLTDAEIGFSWKRTDGVSSYVLIISDQKGDIILEKQTKDKSLNITSFETKLISEQHYFWYVRAKFIDGRIAESAPRKFSFKK